MKPTKLDPLHQTQLDEKLNALMDWLSLRIEGVSTYGTIQNEIELSIIRISLNTIKPLPTGAN